MYDDDGRKLHIGFQKFKAHGKGETLFLIPTIGITEVHAIEYRPEYIDTAMLRPDIRQYYIGIGWLRWQASVIFAEWRDDRTIEELVGEDELDDKEKIDD